MGKNTAVFGIFATRMQGEKAIQDLKDAGFRNTDISYLVPENIGSKDLATDKETKASEGTAVGGVSGATIGGILGWLVGAGSIAIPGLGLFVAAGPIMAALAGAGAGGAIGGASGSLIGAGIPEYVVKRYTGLVKEGKVLISVHCDSNAWVENAKTVLKNAGASEVDSTSEVSSGVISGTATDKPYVNKDAITEETVY